MGVGRLEGVVLLTVEDMLPLALEAVLTQIDIAPASQPKTEAHIIYNIIYNIIRDT